IKELAAASRVENVPSVVLSFFPHPTEILRGEREDFYLTTPDERSDLFADLGVDVAITHPFDQQVAQTPARDFVLLLKRHLGFTQLRVGADFALGHNREGNVEFLQRLGGEMDFKVHVVPPVMQHGEVISSSRIRALLHEGAVESAARFLGRPYSISGQVVRGAGRGHSLGIPTANLDIWKKRLVPAIGIYVTQATVKGKSWGSVTSIGVRPTFNDNLPAPVVETYLLDYDDGQFYGETLNLDFIARLRDEEKFSIVDELMAQIDRDIEAARSILAKTFLS
ncbi:MAG: riboflavin biosynthesis protein RibF, partial [Anaerolineales bacterium]